MNEIGQLEHRARLAEFFGGLTQPQKDFIRDPSRKKAALCSRRAGKTYSTLAYIVKMALQYPESSLLYIALTRGSAKDIIWRDFKRLDRHLGLGCEFNGSALTVLFPNGAVLYVRGADHEDQIEKFNGQRFQFIAIDECGSFPVHLKKMVIEVLNPTLMDTEGTFVLLGTPKAHCRGMFYEATTGGLAGWSVHSWTWRDNPHVPQGWVAEDMALQGIREDDAGYQREYCGKWVRSEGQLLYPYSAERNHYDQLPVLRSPWNHVIGIDFGWSDDTAFYVMAYNPDVTELYGLAAWKRQQLTLDAVEERLSSLIEQYPGSQIVADTGGLGKTLVETLNHRYPRHIKTAQKTEKLAHAAMVRADLRAGRIKVKRTDPIVQEWDRLQLDEDGKEDPSMPNHLSDAFLYAYRQARHYWGIIPEIIKPNHELSNDEHYRRFQNGRAKQRELIADTFGQPLDMNDLFR